MVEINEAERKKEKKKELKEMRTNSETQGQCQMPQYWNHRTPRRKRPKEKP